MRDTPELAVNANMVAGGYALDLYCKYVHPYGGQFEFPHQYTGELGSDCRRRARKAGWIIHRDGYATCPECAKKLTTP